jgi:tetratricopeptide (TPR) repeat protein
LIATLDDYKDQVLTRVRESGNYADEASFLVALGTMYVAQGELSKGIQQHQRAIRIHESHSDWVAAARVYWTIAKLDPGAAGDLKTAITYMERAIALAGPLDKDALAPELAAMRRAG